MANRKKVNQKPGKAARIALAVFLALLLAFGALTGIGALNANTVRLRRAEVALPDLPSVFEGVRLLYASDIDLCGINTPEKSAALITQLQDAQPDMLILGGDYTSSSLFKILNTPAGSNANAADRQRARSDFFHYIRSFDAPLGKYALAAPEDGDWEGLQTLLEECGFRSLINARQPVERDGEKLWLTGVCQKGANLNAAGSFFSNSDCVILTAYSPEVLPVLLTSEAADGGPWADMILAGHTQGGQIRLYGRSVLDLTDLEKRYLYGWRFENGLPILTTSGVGCEGVNLRLGSTPEVWLITLTRTHEVDVSRETSP